jgi:hypothetical protein
MTVPAAAAIWLVACATPASDCPPLVAYPPALLAQAADELARLPPDSAIETLLADYAVTRAQLRACGR